jgi:hypothetical protein
VRSSARAPRSPCQTMQNTDRVPCSSDARRCAWTQDVNKPCLSCLVSEQAAIESSGLLIPIDDYSCFSTTFEVPLGSDITPALCPGTYFVSGCETTEAQFNQRVSNIKEIITETKQEREDCFDAGGERNNVLEGCQTVLNPPTSPHPRPPPAAAS